MLENDQLIKLSHMRRSLKSLMQPQVLSKLAEFLEKTRNEYDDGSLIERYQWFVENAENGEECKYAQIAKDLFLSDQAEEVAYIINDLYENWSKHCK